MIVKDGDTENQAEDVDMEGTDETKSSRRSGDKKWVELSIEIPGMRDDDPMPIFLAAMLSEALLATGELVGRLHINVNWHWKLYIDVSTHLSFPLEHW